MSHYKADVYYYIRTVKGNKITLQGPLDDIYELKSAPNNKENWAYVQIKDGELTRAFTHDEVHTTRKKI